MLSQLLANNSFKPTAHRMEVSLNANTSDSDTERVRAVLDDAFQVIEKESAKITVGRFSIFGLISSWFQAGQSGVRHFDFDFRRKLAVRFSG